MLDVDEVTGSVAVDQSAVEPAPAVVRPVSDWEVANQRKIDAVEQLAPFTAALDDIEARIAELLLRTEALELD